jgi:hypothetical protein
MHNDVAELLTIFTEDTELQYKNIHQMMKAKGWSYELKLVRALKKALDAGILEKRIDERGKVFYRLAGIMDTNHLAYLQEIASSKNHIFEEKGIADLSVFGIAMLPKEGRIYFDMALQKMAEGFYDLIDLHVGKGKKNLYLQERLALFYFMMGLDMLTIHTYLGRAYLKRAYFVRLLRAMMGGLEKELKEILKEEGEKDYDKIAEKYMEECFERGMVHLSLLLKEIETTPLDEYEEVEQGRGLFLRKEGQTGPLLPQVAVVITPNIEEAPNFVKYPGNFIRFWFKIIASGTDRKPRHVEIAEIIDCVTKSLLWHRKRLRKSDLKMIKILPFLVKEYGKELTEKMAEILYYAINNYSKVIEKYNSVFLYAQEELLKTTTLANH